jgi:hypothetical protein
MKLCVLVPSEAYRQNAGARIRYGRLVDALATHDVELQLAEIGEFDPTHCDADVLLISKCHDARAQLVAIEARRRVIPVGVDLFDDYFSQQHDARLVRFRHWLANLAPWLSFALTSTEAMAKVASRYAKGVPVLVVNDVAAVGPDKDILVAAAEDIDAKRLRALDEDQLRIAWFGIGDNPFFSVGLSDVAAYAGELAALARLSGMAVKLTILTNLRSLTAEGLAKIARLPVPVEVREWSEEAEAMLLQDSFACFVPVNAQGFSSAKSLNRAVTALTAGCQLLSVGFPLYEPLDRLLYRDVSALAADLKSDELRVSAARRNELVEEIDQWARATREAEKLASFLASLPRPEVAESGKVALIHGAGTNEATNKVARAMGDVTVGSPYAPTNLEVDAWARAWMPFALDLLVTDALARDLKKDASSLDGPVDHAKKRYLLLSEDSQAEGAQLRLELPKLGLGVQIALYRSVMDRIRERLSTGFGIDQPVLSENSTIPFPLHTDGHQQ